MPQLGTWIKTDGTETVVSPKNGKRFELAELQGYVGGYIESTYTRKPKRQMWINEEGLIHNLPINPRASELIAPEFFTAGGIRGDVLLIQSNRRSS